MFKSVRWRSDKNKIKVVFKLQFHATQVAQLGENALMISVIPGDVGKPMVRLEKAAIQDGCCRWGNAVYETVKFVKEPRTGKIRESIYNFVVSTGSPEAGFLGEASIDFADYAEATKTSTVSLPLKNSRSKAILHVSIQKVQENVDEREIEEPEDARVKTKDRSLRTQISNSDTEEINKSNSIEEKSPSKTIVNAELNGNCGASTGSDITLSSSESSSGLNTPREQNPNGFVSSLSHPSVPYISTENTPTTIYEEHQRSKWEWSGGSDHGTSTDSTNDFQDTFIRERSQLASDVEIEKLRSQLVALDRQVDLSELELQTLRKQIVKESKRGQDLLREVVSLKEERDVYKLECEKLKNFRKHMDEAKVKNKLHFDGGDPWVLLEEVRQELNYEKNLNANLRLQLQKMQESNAELMLAVQDLDEMLEQKNKEMPNLSNKSGSRDNAEEVRGNVSRSETDDDEEQKALEELLKEHRDVKEIYMLEQKIMDLSSEIEIYRRDRDDLEMQMEQLALDYEILKQENQGISHKLEQSQLQGQLTMQYECSSSFANANELEMHIETLENDLRKKSKDFSDSLDTIKELQTQIAGLANEHKKQSKEFSDSQATIKELETQIEGLENELKKQSKEFSDSLATIKELEAHIQNLEEHLEKQVDAYEADLEVLTHAKVEQEQRAIQAEEALRKTRVKNANTAEKLQEEFRRLSVQMASTFDANEKVAMKALAEVSELRMQKSSLEEMLRRSSEEVQLVRVDYETKLSQLSAQLNTKTDQIEQMLKEIDNMSKQLEQQKQHEEEVSRAFSMEILLLKAEMEKLRIDSDSLHENAEQKESLRDQLEEMKTSVKEYELLIQRVNMERNELESSIVLARKEAEKSLEELRRMRHVQDEKEAAVELLKSELEMHKAECHDLKNSLFEDELEKEKLRNQVFQLKGELKKKEGTLTGLEKKLKDSNRRASVSDGTRTTLRNNKPSPVPQGTKEIASLREKIKLLEGQIKLKEIALETSTNSFLEKEKDLWNKIEELESRMEEFNRNSSSFHKVVTDTMHLTSNGDMSEENGNTIPLVKSDDDISIEKELKPSTINNKDHNIADMLSELALLKEKNNYMETELGEMQERYSEISLKFAEVEGERQKLVMTVRSLKNAKKRE